MSDHRLTDLKAQAVQALQTLPSRVPAAESSDTQSPQALLEDLRIYQVELELQNDSLVQAEQKATLASQKYAQLFEFLPLPALVLSANAQIREDNALAREWLTDCTPSALGDFRLTRCLSKPDRNRLLRALARCTDSQVQKVERIRLEPPPAAPKTGAAAGVRVADAHCVKLSPAYHADPHFAVLLMDKSAELAREADRQLFQNLIDSSDDLIYATDPGGHIILANNAMLNAMSQPASKVLGQVANKLLAQEHAAQPQATQAPNPQSGDSTLVLSTPDSAETRLFANHRFDLRDRQGQLLGKGFIARDITDSHLAREMQQLSETVFMNALEAIIVTDEQTCIKRANPAFWRMSGLSPQEALGQPTRILRSGHHPDAFYQGMWAVINATGHWEGEIVNRHATSGRNYAVWTTIAALSAPDGKVSGYMAVQTDLTAVQEAQSQIKHMASYDPLTDLPNRALFHDRIGQLIHQCKRNEDRFALLFIDLDHFKDVNDTLGHLAGDELLKIIAGRLKTGVRQGDTVARMGGDEFVVLLPHAHREQGMAVASTLQRVLGDPVDLNNAPGYQPRASVGVAVYPDDGTTPDLLLQHADTAMYAAKVSGRNQAHAYNAALSAEAEETFKLQTELSHALKLGQLCLHWQPKFRLSDLALVGAEALVRWERPGHGLMPPGAFLPQAQKAGLLSRMDDWVLEQALNQVAQWHAQGCWSPSYCLGVNQTAEEMRMPAWGERLETLIERHPIRGIQLEIELSEGSFAQPSEGMQKNLARMAALGVHLSIDDFGTGYSSLSYLKNLPVATIKIDQSFVRHMVDDPNDRAVVEAVLAMAQKLGRTVVAEGVETEAQRACLRGMGCEVGQGYLVSPPVTATELVQRFLQPQASPVTPITIG